MVSPAGIERVPLGESGTQRVMVRATCGDRNELLMGISSLPAGHRSPLIEHDLIEVAYVLGGSGWMVTDNAEHPFAAGQAIVIAARCWHSIRAGADVEMLFVFPTSSVPPTRKHESESS